MKEMKGRKKNEKRGVVGSVEERQQKITAIKWP